MFDTPLPLNELAPVLEGHASCMKENMNCNVGFLLAEWSALLAVVLLSHLQESLKRQGLRQRRWRESENVNILLNSSDFAGNNCSDCFEMHRGKVL